MTMTPEENSFLMSATAGTFHRGRMLGDREGLDVLAAVVQLLRNATFTVVVNDHADPAPAELVTAPFDAWMAHQMLGAALPMPLYPDAVVTFTLSGGTAPTINGVAGPISFTPNGAKITGLVVADTAPGTVTVDWVWEAGDLPPGSVSNSGNSSVIFS